jgi:hypothetical protein
MKQNKLFIFFLLLSFSGFAFAGDSVGGLLTLGVAVISMALGVPPIWAFAATFATSIITSRIFAPNQNQGVNSGSIGSTNARQQVPPDTTTPVPMAYGITYLGGKFVDAALRTDQKVMYYAMAISCKSEDSVVIADTTSMYYGDRKITFSTENPTRVASLTDTAGNVDTSIDNLLFINIYVSDKDGNVVKLNGTKYPWEFEDAGDGGLTSLQWADRSGLIDSQQWVSTDRRMNGLIWATIRLSYSTTAQTTSLSPITFRIGQFLKDTATTKPGDVWLDYMTNTVYGAAVPIEFIDTASATALNNYSDELITYNDYDGNPQTQPRYRINGVIDPSQGCLQNVDQIMTACDSWQKYDATNGKWSIVINKATTSSYSFNDSNLIGPIVVGSIDIAQMPNQIEAKFPDQTNRDQYNYVNESVPSYLLLPNEPINKISLNYDLVNNSVQALYLANRVLEQSREDLLVTINTTYDGIQVNAGDVIDLTNSYYGWTNKLFRAMQVKESITQDGLLSAQIQLIEYNAQVYDNATINEYTPFPNGNLDNPGYFSALSPPTEVNILPYISVPSFDINIAIPETGRVSYIILYYTTVASPTTLDWNVLDTQKLSDGQVYANGTAITFPHYTIPANTYYFAYVVGNGIAQSQLSPISSAFVWTPDPANASSFTLNFNPATLQVPYSGGVASFAGVTCKLYGQNGLGGVDFVPSQTDSDAAFIAGTWRIGNSTSTGYSDIVKTNISVPDPTDGGTHADFGIPTAMTSSTATMLVPVRYKDLGGTVHQVSPATIQYAYAVAGTSANKYATGFLYQWSPTTPTNPSGTSIYTWATGSMSSYTGSGGWQTYIPANPGTPSIRLWQSSKGISDISTATTTSVSWTSGYFVADITQNGAAGLQSAQPTVFQWAVTIPSSPTGTSTYTWATTSFTPTPSGWSLTPGTSPSSGYTLWGATVQLVDSASVTTSSINWTTASITARGYAGSSGTNGTNGASSRICYASTTSSSLNSTPATYTTSGSSSFPPYNTWGGAETWVATPPTISAGQSVYQSDGIYSPSTGNTVWNVPYLSSLKVGSLSAITANMGSLTSGTITGALIRTAASGQRVEMDYSTNYLSSYDSSGSVITQIGGTYGTVYVNTASTLSPPAGFYNNASGVPSIYARNSTGNGVEGNSYSSGIGIIGVALYAGGTNHGVRGQNNGYGGTQTSGLVGVSNGYDFYADGAGTNYGPFTGAHDVLIPVGTTIPIGYIVCDVKLIIAKNISNTVFEVAMSSSANQVPIGVMVTNNGLLSNSQPASFIEKYEYTEVDDRLVTTTIMYPEYDANKDSYDYCAANAVGEGQVYVCGEAGNIAAGDLIVTSSVAGVGMKQSDNIVQNITVAKARQAVTFADTTTPVLVACIYLCG